ncbi:MAG TPA: hypothetical protein VN914_14010, partial [Polyangia bacterium]|nr:hypothetical protein [Polyangia bacterium]
TMVVVGATITADTTWTADKTYVLPPETKVAVKAPAVLTIEAGTVIMVQSKSSLVITRGAKIMAVGTKEKPIVFTSSKPAGMKAPGDWGGLIIMGKAPINVNKLATPPSDEGIFEAFGANEEDGKFGGTDPMDSSGTLKYVHIEFGGAAYLPDREWNNLTFCGVGAGTTVDFVQSHAGADDGAEFFGGTVNVKHLVLSQNEDDGFDTDNGYQGKAQFVIIQHISPKGTDASNGYESDNHGNAAAYKAEPRTIPTAYNVTSIGKKDYTVRSFGMLFRRGTAGKYFNHIVMNWSAGAAEIRDMATVEQVTAGNAFVKNSIFFGNNGANGTNWPTPMAPADDADEAMVFMAADKMNREADPMLTDPLNPTAPNFAPKAGSPALTGGATPPSDGFFDATATFVGAIGTEDWTAGWTSYPAPKAQ